MNDEKPKLNPQSSVIQHQSWEEIDKDHKGRYTICILCPFPHNVLALAEKIKVERSLSQYGSELHCPKCGAIIRHDSQQNE